MLFVGTSIIHPSTEGVFLLCNILDLLIYSFKFNISIPKEGKLIIKEIEEHDSTKEAWEFYKRKYGEYLDLEDKEIKFGNEISFKVHGETDFNFALDKVDEFIYITINEQIQNIAQKKDTLCRRMYN